MMKLKVTFVSILLCAASLVSAQDKGTDSKGVMTGKVFFNYHLDQTSGVTKKTAFELSRAYFGYKYAINDKFSATVLFDAGKGSAGSDYTVFVKNAKLDYKANDMLTLSAGLFGLKQFSEQEKFWGYRYVYKSFDDEHGFGSSADLGVMASFKFSSMFKMDVLMVNGEGYKKVQDASGKTRFGANFVFTPTKSLLLKAYYDTMSGIDAVDPTKNTTVSNLAFFAGYKITDDFRMGAEYNIMQNGTSYKSASDGKDLNGMSFYTTYNLDSKWNVFGRYDVLSSNKLTGQTTNWNNSKDGKTIIAGVEYKPAKNVNTSLNFRSTKFDNSAINKKSLVYLNLEFKF